MSATTVEIKKQITDENFKRYVLSVVSWQEHMVVENLEQRVKKQWLDEDVIDYLVPVINKTTIKKDGSKSIKESKLYPWYVFVKSKMNDKIRYVIRNTPWVRLIVWAETHPIPVSDAEYENIIQQMQETDERAQLEVPFRLEDLVILNDGNFAGMQWKIKEIDTDRGMAIVHVEILWRLTPVALEFSKIQLAN